MTTTVSAAAPPDTRLPTDFLTMRRMSRTFPSPDGELRALSEIDLSIRAGEFVAVIGRSGSGKSTLAAILAGLDQPSAGEVWVGGTALHRMAPAELLSWRGRGAGLVRPGGRLIPSLTLLENVLLPMELHGRLQPRARLSRAHELLAQFGLAALAGRGPAEVSAEDRVCAALARALANDPPLLVADDPTAGLTNADSEEVFRLLRAQAAAGKTVVLLTPDEDYARQVDRTLLIADGKIVNEHLARALATLSSEQLIEIARRTQPITYMPGQTIVRQGDLGEHLYVLIDGTANVLLEHPSGKQILVERLARGQIFGEMALIGHGPRSATVQASEEGPVTVVAIGRGTFERLIAESASLRHDLGRVVDQRRAQLYLQALSRLTSADLLRLSQPIRVDTYPPGTVVVQQGAPGDTFFIIVEGIVDVVVQRPGAAELVLARLSEGQYFGEMAIVNKATRNATVRVGREGPAKLVELTKATFFALIQQSPEFKTQLDDVVGGRRQELDLVAGR